MPEITHLPGLVGNLTSRAYSGYLRGLPGHHLFYTFVESKSDPSKDPLLLWTNGGPGCSSMLGFFTENGPYMLTNTPGELVSNPYSWNARANYLYVEHPVGVGFSYATDEADYLKLGDESEAHELYAALTDFYRQFPALYRRDLYLTGESYAGEYIPHLAHTIAFGPDAVLASSLRGVALGNPIFNCRAYVHDGVWATYTLGMLYYTGLIPYEGPYADFMGRNCSAYPQFELGDDAEIAACYHAYLDAEDSAGSWSQGLEEPVVMANGTGANGTWGHQAPQEPHRNARYRKSAGGAVLQPAAAGVVTARETSDSTPDAAEKEVPNEPDYDPDNKLASFCTGNSSLEVASLPNAHSAGCNSIDSVMSYYLNRADVREALHVRSHAVVMNSTWSACTSRDLKWTYDRSNSNILTSYYEPLLKSLAPERFRVLIYSGVEDVAVVSPAETEQCLAELGDQYRGKRTQQWTPWRVNGAAVGYWESHERLTFATVKSAGHMAPTNQPLSALTMLSRWMGQGVL